MQIQANFTQVHTRAPIKMAAGVVSMVFHFGMWFWTVSTGITTNYHNIL